MGAPAPLGEAPSRTRYPLFADEVGPGAAAAPPEGNLVWTAAGVAPPRRTWLWWMLAAGLCLLAALGIWLMTLDDATEPPTSHPPNADPDKSSRPVDVADDAVVKAPRTAPPTTDTEGHRVSYRAGHLLDDRARTCWRVAGDAAGTTLVFTLAEPTKLSRVGMINGYAKSATDPGGTTLNWYLGNRRVTRATWEFDNGTSVSQSLRETRARQTLDFPAVRTRKVRLTIESVTPPGAGPESRDYTAISEVILEGVPTR